MNNITLFLKGPLSQWYLRAPFNVAGITFNCCEQFMMASKAKFFKDEEIYQQIMNEPNPKEQKALGRKVRNFVEKDWNNIAKIVVYRGNFAKFTQNPDVCKILTQTDGLLAEANPYDTIWGIGLSESDPRAYDKSQWRGTNWLGEMLTKVREGIRSKGFDSCFVCGKQEYCLNDCLSNFENKIEALFSK